MGLWSFELGWRVIGWDLGDGGLGKMFKFLLN